MTTIALDANGFICADSRATRGDEIVSDAVEKLFVRKGCHILALSGSAHITKPVYDWYEAGADAKATPKCDEQSGWTLLVIDRSGVFIYINDTPYPLPIPLPYAIGTGQRWAMAAMLSGKSAKEAVEIACSRDVWSGLPIQVVNIDEALGLARIPEAAE